MFALPGRVRPHELVSTDITHSLASHFRYRKNIRSRIRGRSCFCCIVSPAAACVIVGRSRSMMTFIERARKWTWSEVKCVRASSAVYARYYVRLARFCSRRLVIRVRIYSFASRMMKNRAKSSSSFAYAYRSASRALHVPIKSFGNFVRRAIGAHATLL